MSPISNEQLLSQLTWRYAVKKFDAQRKIPDNIWQALETSLILSPSSYGLQPWKFFVITDESTKSQLPQISWNQKQPQDCSHMVVLAARRSMDADYIDRYMDSVCSVRGLPDGAMTAYRNVLVSTVDKLEEATGVPHQEWNAKQVYLALGQLMVAAALLGVDTCPMEGINHQEYDRLLGLTDSEYTSVVGCAVGYRHPEDAQATAKKVRFAAQEVVHHI